MWPPGGDSELRSCLKVKEGNSGIASGRYARRTKCFLQIHKGLKGSWPTSARLRG